MRSNVKNQIHMSFAIVALSCALAYPTFISSVAHAQGTPDPTPVVKTGDNIEVGPNATPAAVETKTGDVVSVPPNEVIAVNDTPDTVTNESFFASLASAIGGIRGQTTLAIVLIVAQLLIQLTKTPLFGSVFHAVDGNIKLCIVTGLTVVTTIIPLMVQGMGFWAALCSGAVLSAVMVFGNQVYKQFVKDPAAAKVA